MASTATNKLIVSIDFGTTFSGVVCGETALNPGPVGQQLPPVFREIQIWPNEHGSADGKRSKKVPTKLRYLDNPPGRRHGSVSDNPNFQWGFQIPEGTPEREILQWFKLDLDPSQRPLANAARHALSSGRQTGYDADEAVRQYVSALRDHLMYALGQQRLDDPSKIPAEFLVSVPAVWSDRAKNRTRDACQLALGGRRPGQSEGSSEGSDPPVRLVSEPDAAAVYSIYECQHHGLNIGDSFVVCDAGGGTVDLISYTITKLDPILEVEEAAPGSGALCGSVCLNWRFKQLITRRLGNHHLFTDEFAADAMDHFDELKRNFGLDDIERTYLLPYLNPIRAGQPGFYEQSFVITSKDLQEIFEPSIVEIIQLVRKQIASTRKAIRAVFLVGGFGTSNYLRRRLRNAISPDVQVLRPHDAWLAVAYGTVMMGLALTGSRAGLVNVTGRRARKHYGIRINVPFSTGLHKRIKNDRFWCPVHAQWRVTVMDWFIERGSRVSENQPFRRAYSQHWEVAKGRSGLDWYYLSILADETEREAPLTKDDEVRKLCKLDAGFGRIPTRDLPTRTGADGKLYYWLDFEIEIVFFSANTRYTLIFENNRHNTVTVEYV